MTTMPKPGSPAFNANLTRLYERRLLNAVRAAAKDCGRLHMHAGAPSAPAVSHHHEGDGRLVIEVSLLLPPAGSAEWRDG